MRLTGFVERNWGMSVEIVEADLDFTSLRKQHIDQGLHRQRKVLAASMFGGFEMPPVLSWLERSQPDYRCLCAHTHRHIVLGDPVAAQ